MSIGLLILGLVLFILLVVVHELGHFVLARRNGVKIEEFGIFFPPRLWSRKTKAGWEFSINLIPLGGFVRLHGEHDGDRGNGTYGAASLPAKVKIMVAGVAVNLVAAFVLLMVLAWIGMPQLVNNQFSVKSDTKIVKNEILIGYVEPGSPAAKAGLKTSDQLLAIIPKDGAKRLVKSADKLPNLTKSLAGQTVKVEFNRDGTEHSTTATLLTEKIVNASLKTNSPKGYIGISPTAYKLQRSTWSAPVVAGGLIGQFTALTFKGIGTALHGLGSIIAGFFTGNTAARQAGQTNASSQVAGPVGIFMLLKDGSLLGFQFVLAIIAVISLTLAIMNILPIPALDGGRLFVTLVARSFRKQLSQRFEEGIYGAGFALLLVLIVLITIVDVKRNF